MRGFAWLEAHSITPSRVYARDGQGRRVVLYAPPRDLRPVGVELSADGQRMVVALMPATGEALGQLAFVDLRTGRSHLIDPPGPGVWSLESPALADTGTHLLVAARRQGLPLVEHYVYRLDLHPRTGELATAVVAGVALENGHPMYGPRFLPGGERLLYLRAAAVPSGEAGIGELAALELGREGDSAAGLAVAAPGRQRLTLTQGAQASVKVTPAYCAELRRTFYVSPVPGDRVRVCSHAPGGQPIAFESIHDEIRSLAVDPAGEWLAWRTADAVFVTRATGNLNTPPAPIRKVEGPPPTGPLRFVDGRLWYGAAASLMDVGPERADARVLFKSPASLLEVLPLPDDRRALSRIAALNIAPPDARSDAAVEARADLFAFLSGLPTQASPFEALTLLTELHGDAAPTEWVASHLETQHLRAGVDARATDDLVFALVAAAHLCTGAEQLASLCAEAAARLDDDGALPGPAQFLALRVVESARIDPEAEAAETDAAALPWLPAPRPFDAPAVFGELAALQARRATALSHDDAAGLDTLRADLSRRFKAAQGRAQHLVPAVLPEPTREPNDAEVARRFEAERDAVLRRIEAEAADRRAQKARGAAAREAAERATRQREADALKAAERLAAEQAAAAAAAKVAAEAAVAEAEARRLRAHAADEDERAEVERMAAQSARRAEAERLAEEAISRAAHEDAAAQRRRETIEIPPIELPADAPAPSRPPEPQPSCAAGSSKEIELLRAEVDSMRAVVAAERAAREAAEEAAAQATTAEARAHRNAEVERADTQALLARARADAEAERAHRLEAEGERDAVRARLEEEAANRQLAVHAAEKRAEALRQNLDAEREIRAVVEAELAEAHEARHAAEARALAAQPPAPPAPEPIRIVTPPSRGRALVAATLGLVGGAGLAVGGLWQQAGNANALPALVAGGVALVVAGLVASRRGPKPAP